MRKYFLKTERVSFSWWEQEDYDLAYSLWGDEAVTKHIAKNGKFSPEEIKARLDLEISNHKLFNVQYWPIFDNETNDLIGCCGLRPYNLDENIYELGFHLRSKYWGKGLGLEAATAIIQYAFDKLSATKLFAAHSPDNINSKKILEKLGFQYVGDEFYKPTELYHPSYLLNKV